MTLGWLCPDGLPIHFLSGVKDGARPPGRGRLSRPVGPGQPLPSSVPAENPGRGVQLLERKDCPLVASWST